MTAPAPTPSVDVGHLSPESLTALRASLAREQSVQTTQAADCRATTSALTGQTDVDSILEREIAETAVARAEDAIADIGHALERLDATYGTCEHCDGAIRFERLEFIPQARFCVTCHDSRSGLRLRAQGNRHRDTRDCDSKRGAGGVDACGLPPANSCARHQALPRSDGTTRIGRRAWWVSL